MTITPKQFAAVCYCILMDHHGSGFVYAHPRYIEEKLPILNTGYDAYYWLDRSNQLEMIRYLAHWQVELPEPVARYEEELKQLL